MRIRNRQSFSTITTEGSILPADLLERVADLTISIEGRTPEGYHLIAGEKLNEAVTNSWNRALAAWRAFSTARSHLSSSDTGTTVTRERWLLPLFNEMQWGRLTGWKAIEASGRSFPISHGRDQVPIHLVGCAIDLDHRAAGVAGASRTSPHGLVQELLNASDDYLWGIVSNGLKLRILRDNSSLTRQAFVEFDLEVMMNGEVYADFAVFWLLCHFSGFEAPRPEECRIEKWSRLAVDEGTRALDQLRIGVETAIEALGHGFLKHAANARLRDCLHSGELSTQDYYRQVLRLVYRLLFLFVAEDRDLLNLPEQNTTAPDDASATTRSSAASPRERYMRFYSASRLRDLAVRRQGTRHTDLYTGLRLIMGMLGKGGCPSLALPELGSFLWSREAISEIVDCEIENYDLLESIRELAYTRSGDMLRRISYKNLGTEELGSVYESLLERHPLINVAERTFTLATSGGNEQKTSGTYYTPSSLVTCLLDTALDPVLDEATKKPNAEQAILALKVCDPACGSGHFLIAAAHRIAKRLATVRTGNDEPSPGDVRHALREVIGHCIYGVDINPMSVELCKVALWMEALEPGKPLSFLDHHIQCGNSLLGTTPALMAKGIPDEAFIPIEGDDKKVCAAYKKRNKEERKNVGQLSLNLPAWNQLGNLSAAIGQIERSPDDTPEDVHQIAETYASIIGSASYLNNLFLADLWCSAFVWKKVDTEDGSPPYIPSDKMFHDIRSNPHSAAQTIRRETQRLQAQYKFFHWHLAFPTVFKLPMTGEEADNEKMGWSGGFDCVLGNPPWERIKLQEKEWFADRDTNIAQAKTSARRVSILQLKLTNPKLYAAFMDAKRMADAEGTFARISGCFPLSGRGDVNTYALFAELVGGITTTYGYAGIIVPSGIATDETTSYFFQHLMTTESLVTLFDFENRQLLFPTVDARMRFCLLVTSQAVRLNSRRSYVAFYLHNVDDLRKPGVMYSLNNNDIRSINPNSKTCPVMRSERDAALVKDVHSRISIMCDETKLSNPWGVYYIRMIDFSDHTSAIILLDEKEESKESDNTNDVLLPLIEPKLLYYYDHRFGTFDGTTIKDRQTGNSRTVTYAEHQDPWFRIKPRYAIAESFFEGIMSKYTYRNKWIIGYREITNSTNERTLITSLIPLLPASRRLVTIGLAFPLLSYCILANLSSFALDYVARQKLGSTALAFFVFKQLPILSPDDYQRSPLWAPLQTLAIWICPRILELIFTGHDIVHFANDCGYDGPPFTWDEDRRFLLRCELDSAYFHLYGINRDDVDYIMETFLIIKRKDEKAYGEYRTKRVVLEMYDHMTEAAATGIPYQTWLDPPPANGWTPPAEPIEKTVVAADFDMDQNEQNENQRETEEVGKPLTLFDIPSTVIFKTPHADRPKKKVEANPYFRRSVLAAAIIDQLYMEPTFGHVKFQKIFELCELDSDIRDLETKYYRQAAGPYDPHAFRSIHSQLKKLQWFGEEPRSNGYGYKYVRLAKANEHSKYYLTHFSDKNANIQRIIDLLRPFHSQECEVIATLYTAWNDLILDGNVAPEKEIIIQEATTQWHKAKAQIPQAQWMWGLGWMHKNQLIPKGTGKPTIRTDQ